MTAANADVITNWLDLWTEEVDEFLPVVLRVVLEHILLIKSFMYSRPEALEGILESQDECFGSSADIESDSRCHCGLRNVGRAHSCDIVVSVFGKEQPPFSMKGRIAWCFEYSDLDSGQQCQVMDCFRVRDS